jgi:hypothetical protein
MKAEQPGTSHAEMLKTLGATQEELDKLNRYPSNSNHI